MLYVATGPPMHWTHCYTTVAWDPNLASHFGGIEPSARGGAFLRKAPGSNEVRLWAFLDLLSVRYLADLNEFFRGLCIVLQTAVKYRRTGNGYAKAGMSIPKMLPLILGGLPLGN